MSLQETTLSTMRKTGLTAPERAQTVKINNQNIDTGLCEWQLKSKNKPKYNNSRLLNGNGSFERLIRSTVS